MGFIDEDLIAGAIEYTRVKKKNGWMKWAAMAACLCLVTCLAVPFLDGFGGSSAPASPDQGDYAPDEKAYGGLQHVQNPVYDVIEYTVPTEYTPAELHIATTTGLDEYDAHMVKYYGDKYLGKGIRVSPLLRVQAKKISRILVSGILIMMVQVSPVSTLLENLRSLLTKWWSHGLKRVIVEKQSKH